MGENIITYVKMLGTHWLFETISHFYQKEKEKKRNFHQITHFTV